MNCTGYHAIFRDFMAGRIGAAQRAELERHVAECKECAAHHEIAREISCRELTDALDEYIEGRLAADRRLVFDRHLSICTACRTYLALYEQAIALAKRAFSDHQEPTAQPVPETLVRSILAERDRR